MFMSKRPKPLSRKIMEIFWPSMGWRRSFRYWRHRIVRLKDSNFSIAAGLATGAAISFTPLPGTHILGSAFICMALRANLLAGVLGTLFGNPWTLPLMWWLAYRIGKFTFILLGYEVRRMPGHFEWREMLNEVLHDPMRLLAPWVTGGFILMIISWPIFYFIFHWILEYMRSTHHLWKKTRLRKEARIITGQLK